MKKNQLNSIATDIKKSHMESNSYISRDMKRQHYVPVVSDMIINVQNLCLRKTWCTIYDHYNDNLFCGQYFEIKEV